jgi:glutathione S-transferase
MMTRFTLYGSPHSLPTYKVALMLRLSDEPFSFRYVSFQKGMHDPGVSGEVSLGSGSGPHRS